MQDGRMRDPEVAGDVLQADGLGAALGETALRRREDLVAGFLGGAAAADVPLPVLFHLSRGHY
jgi:hypothetical protein